MDGGHGGSLLLDCEIDCEFRSQRVCGDLAVIARVWSVPLNEHTPMERSTSRQQAVVIHPGSHTLRIGLTNTLRPRKVAHVIARRFKRQPLEAPNCVEKMSRVKEDESMSLQRERQLRVVLHELMRRQKQLTQQRILANRKRMRDEDGGLRARADEATAEKQADQAADQIHSHRHTDKPAFDATNAPLPYGQAERDQDDMFWVRAGTNYGGDGGDCPGNADEAGNGDDSVALPPFIAGTAATRLAADSDYIARWPIREGHLNLRDDSQQELPAAGDGDGREDGGDRFLAYSSRAELRADLCALWTWALKEECGIDGADDLASLRVLLLVRDVFHKEDVKDMVDVLLRDMRVAAVTLQQEGAAVGFGSAAPLACVADVGDQHTSVCCVEEGVALPATQVSLPYGGEDVAATLQWLMNREGCGHWVPAEWPGALADTRQAKRFRGALTLGGPSSQARAELYALVEDPALCRINDAGADPAKAAAAAQAAVRNAGDKERRVPTIGRPPKSSQDTQLGRPGSPSQGPGGREALSSTARELRLRLRGDSQCGVDGRLWHVSQDAALLVAPLALLHPTLFDLRHKRRPFPWVSHELDLWMPQGFGADDPQDHFDDSYFVGEIVALQAREKGASRQMKKSGASKGASKGGAEESKLSDADKPEKDAQPTMKVEECKSELSVEVPCARQQCMGGIPVPMMGLDHAIFHSICRAPADLRCPLLANVVLAGGSTLFKQLPQELEDRIAQLALDHDDEKKVPQVHVNYDPKGHAPDDLAWIGARKMCSLEGAAIDAEHPIWITREEWVDHGPRMLRLRLPFVW